MRLYRSQCVLGRREEGKRSFGEGRVAGYIKHKTQRERETSGCLTELEGGWERGPGWESNQPDQRAMIHGMALGWLDDGVSTTTTKKGKEDSLTPRASSVPVGTSR